MQMLMNKITNKTEKLNGKDIHSHLFTPTISHTHIQENVYILYVYILTYKSECEKRDVKQWIYENQNSFTYMTNIEQKIYVVVAQCHFRFFHKKKT